MSVQLINRAVKEFDDAPKGSSLEIELPSTRLTVKHIIEWNPPLLTAHAYPVDTQSHRC